MLQGLRSRRRVGVKCTFGYIWIFDGQFKHGNHRQDQGQGRCRKTKRKIKDKEDFDKTYNTQSLSTVMSLPQGRLRKERRKCLE